LHFFSHLLFATRALPWWWRDSPSDIRQRDDPLGSRLEEQIGISGVARFCLDSVTASIRITPNLDLSFLLVDVRATRSRLDFGTSILFEPSGLYDGFKVWRTFWRNWVSRFLVTFYELRSFSSETRASSRHLHDRMSSFVSDLSFNRSRSSASSWLEYG
jgi:hypothetical protein